MTRISTVDSPDHPVANVLDHVDAVLSHRPDALAAMKGLAEKILTTGTLPGRLMELVRLRIGFHNQCRTCMAVRYQPEDVVTEDLVCSLERPEEADDLTDQERAALRFADLLAVNHFGIDDRAYDELRRYFSDGEIVELGMYCAYCVGFGRFFATLKVTEMLVDTFRVPGDGERVTPWGHDRVERPLG
ncbi:carboxymuconolactone decarboxylase family protein [Sphingobium sp. EM0848]|uniref:carboxymuconolactone decarboxylase family protein n=1 Tax=Sphingobium sp. EM0848 TaxID=2743473 RepID=UPI00159C94FE|nr:carboxymuconolactone decarboxylase family protein [Sphingobium sp. EM0848]